MDYPLAVFDDRGKRLSSEDQTCLIDSRGLWYDPVTKLISGNAYSDYGWFTYKLDAKGMPAEYVSKNEGMNQPDAQSVGAYNPTAKKVLFLYGSQLYMYNRDGKVQDSLLIHWGQKKSAASQAGDGGDASTTPEDYNYTSVIYIGIKGQEIGFLNTNSKQVELYDIQSGYLNKTLSFPDTATTEESFNFAYANSIYWLFDMELRKWVGYK